MSNPPAPQPQPKWHFRPSEWVLDRLRTNRNGLTAVEREERLKQYGLNALPAPEPDSIFIIFLRQFQSPLIYLLLIATSILAFIDEWVDAGIIAFVLLFNAVAGTIQAGRAQNTMRALQKITKTMATVRIAGSNVVVEDTSIVPGDIILLREGDKVPADARIIQCTNLRVNESPLTGESDASVKRSDPLEQRELAPADQKNMLFKGTLVVGGTGTAVVVGTGMNTFIGGISNQIGEIETEIPLQANIRQLSHLIIKVVLVIGAFIFGLGIFLQQELEVMFSLTIAVIVSAVPEGLPIVLTLLLASGVWRMGKRNVLVKRLQAVEALGEAKVIAVDKTGTITKNELAVSTIVGGAGRYDVEASGFAPEGSLYRDGRPVDTEQDPDVYRLGLVAALCADAEVTQDPESGLWDTQGDPTDGALLVLGRKLGYEREALLQSYHVTGEIPFDASLKYHAVQYDTPEGPLVTVAGASEEILRLADSMYQNGVVVPLTEEKRAELLKDISDNAAKALRMIGLAEKQEAYDELTAESISRLTLVGLVGMRDGLRAEVPEAMARTREAGIKVVMITGDHKETAQAIATDAGIFKPGDTVLTDDDIDRMSEEELAEAIGTATVFARITPEHKLSIVQAYRARGDIVAMTGDGVNDALSLVAADLGVAMGKRGTEVAKEAADLILLDDNFGSIVSAVEEGRGIYVNLKKVLLFLFSTSLGEILLILSAIALLLPAPILAAQLIWINLVTDGVLDVGLAFEPKEKGLMRRNFIKPRRFFLDNWMIQRLLIMSASMAAVALGIFVYYYQKDIGLAMTMTVTTLVVGEWFKVWACRAEYRSVFKTSLTSNKYILFGTVGVIMLHALAIYTPFMQNLLQLEPLQLHHWLIAIVAGSVVLWVDEVRKFIRRNHEHNGDTYV